jgi:transcriptional regulator with XRE-family HTH domain
MSAMLMAAAEMATDLRDRVDMKATRAVSDPNRRSRGPAAIRGGQATLMPTMPTNGDLGQAVRRLRKQRGLTIEALAFAADIHPTYVSGIERGVGNPTWVKICALALALDVPVSALAGDAEVQAQLNARIRQARIELGTTPCEASEEIRMQFSAARGQ